jgi:hypothetical protein
MDFIQFFPFRPAFEGIVCHSEPAPKRDALMTECTMESGLKD